MWGENPASPHATQNSVRPGSPLFSPSPQPAPRWTGGRGRQRVEPPESPTWRTGSWYEARLLGPDSWAAGGGVETHAVCGSSCKPAGLPAKQGRRRPLIRKRLSEVPDPYTRLQGGHFQTQRRTNRF